MSHCAHFHDKYRHTHTHTRERPTRQLDAFFWEASSTFLSSWPAWSFTAVAKPPRPPTIRYVNDHIFISLSVYLQV